MFPIIMHSYVRFTNYSAVRHTPAVNGERTTLCNISHNSEKNKIKETDYTVFSLVVEDVNVSTCKYVFFQVTIYRKILHV